MSIIKMILIGSVLFGISACSTYPSKFRCPETKGIGCTMLSEINQRIDSGEIEEIYACDKVCKSRDGKCSKGIKCHCNKRSYPSLSSGDFNQAKKNTDNAPKEYEDNEYWYFR